MSWGEAHSSVVGDSDRLLEVSQSHQPGGPLVLCRDVYALHAELAKVLAHPTTGSCRAVMSNRLPSSALPNLVTRCGTGL